MSTETTKAVRSDALNAIDARVIEQTRRNVQEFFRGDIDTNTSYESFTGTGGSYNSGYGAAFQETLLISRNKEQSRESVIEGAEDAGASYHEIVPFTDSHLATKDHQYTEEVRELIKRDFHGKAIRQWVSEQGGVDIDESNCPYRAQMDEDLSQYDLLLGSPGHENVEEYRVGRRVIYDDTHPVLHYKDETMFDISDSAVRAEFNEFLRNADQLGPDNLEQLRGDSVAQTQIGFLRSKVDDEESPHFIDDVSMGLDGQFVNSKTLDRLKVFSGFAPHVQGPVDSVAGRRIWDDIPEYDDGETVDIDVCEKGDHYALMNGNEHNPNIYWWAPLPDEDQTVVITTATDNDPLTKDYFEAIGADYEFRTCYTNELDYWQAQNLRVLQTSHHQNARSGGNINDKRTEDLRTGIQMYEGLDHDIPVVDALKSLNKSFDTDVRDDPYLINSARAPSFNGFEDYNVGYVPGPEYYGDEHVQALALFCGKDINVEHDNPDDSCSHVGCTTGQAHCHDETGQYILEHMMESSIKQKVGRFGRNSEPHEEITVFVDSDRIPAELPTEDITDKMTEFSKGEKSVLDISAEADGKITSAEIAEQTDLSEGRVREITKNLREDGFIDTDEYATDDGGHLHGTNQSVESSIVITMEESTDRLPVSEPVCEDGSELGPRYPRIGENRAAFGTDLTSIPDPPDVI